MQGGNRRDQVHAGLPGVDQSSGGLQMQRSPAASGDPLHKNVGTRPGGMHSPEQPAVGNARRAPVHAVGVGRTAGDIGWGAAGGRPRWGCGQDDIDDERGE